MTIPPLLDELLRAPGPPGAEDAVAVIVRREAAALGAEIEHDVLGSTVARVRGTEGGRTLALIAHVDQVGVAVTRFDDHGRARVAPLGAWKAKNAVGARFCLLTQRGQVAGVAVRVGDEGDPSWSDMRLDLGAPDADAARGLAAPGDAAVIVGEPAALAGGRICSVALDDRLGVYAALEALRRLAADPARWDVILVATVQEEAGGHAGAKAATARLQPDAAVVVECTYASDAPSGPAAWGDVPLGSGPAVFRGPVVHPAVASGLTEAAASAGVPIGFESGASTWSDADDVFVAAGGTPTGLLSIPVRHMHTASEIAQLSDVVGATRVLEAYARSLSPDVSFLR